MTRINTIPVQSLCDSHILAEIREITRIPNTIKSGRAIIKNIPPKFTLGTGHVKFFYNKVGYLERRYNELVIECRNRGFNVKDKSSSFDNIPQNLMKDWNPTDESISLIQNRIDEKLAKMKFVKYYGK
jgi:deoxyribonuclease (pyrimidine dimer)